MPLISACITPQKAFLKRGFFMLEVLITMVIIGVGMLGIAAMLMLAHKTSSSSYLKQQAIQCAYNIIDKMRANRQAAINGNYNVSNIVASGTPVIPSAPAANCVSSTCTATQLAAFDTWYWLAVDVSQLPSGAGSIATTTSGVNTLVTVTVQWDDSPAQRTLGAAGQVSSTNANIAQFSIGTSL